MLRAEVGAQVHDLPSPETNKQPGSAHTKPLDTVVGALVGVAQLLLSATEVVHLHDKLGGQLLDTAQFSLDGLELFGSLNSGPILGIGTNVNVEFDMSRRGVDSLG